ncbi:MFS transporter [Actinoplanes sp. HUAS TT8]|uniref:MFS transporter n=1 Tax=Actinoplanes sp. HUAS TT8 TaxID=3447453 RepID=UPI003F525126
MNSVGQFIAERPGNRSRFPGTVRLLLASDLITAAGVGLTQPYLIVLLHTARGLPVAAATGMVALAAVTSLVGNPIAGTLIDRYGPRAVMIAGLLVATLGMLLLALGAGLALAAAGIGVTGLGWSLSVPALSTRLARLVPEFSHQRVYTLQYVLFNVGLAGGAAVGGLVVASASALPSLWLVGALLCLVSAIMARFGGLSASVPADEQGPGYRQALADRRLLPLLGAAALLSTVGYGIYNAAPSVLAVAAHDPAALSWLSVANAVSVIVGATITWRFADRIPARAALLWTAGLWAVAWAICVPTALGTGLAVRPALTVAAILTGAGEVLLAGALPTLVNTIAPEALRGRYNALSSLALTVGMGTGPLLTSAATASGHTLLLLGTAVALAVGAGLIMGRPS